MPPRNSSFLHVHDPRDHVDYFQVARDSDGILNGSPKEPLPTIQNYAPSFDDELRLLQFPRCGHVTWTQMQAIC